jgi:hypothetical protein
MLYFGRWYTKLNTEKHTFKASNFTEDVVNMEKGKHVFYAID